MTQPALARISMASTLLALTLGAQVALAQSRVQYGRITNAVVTTETSSTSRNVGTVVGGTVGLVSGSGQSGSNRALRAVGGGAAGRGIGGLAGRSQVFEYTVLIDGRTIVVVSDQAGKRIGDCVAVEQGQFGNIRLVPESRCAPPPAPRAAAPAAAPAPAPVVAAPADIEAATACDQAKQQVLAAETDDAFALAERRMRLLCGE